MGQKIMLIIACMAVFCFSFDWTSCRAEIYKYINEDGRTVYVDREEKIPLEYRKHTIRIEEDLYTQEPERRPAAEAPRQKEKVQSGAQKKTTRVTIENNTIYVPAKAGIGRQKVGLKLILDTGATRTLLHERVIKDLGTREYSASFIQDATGAVTGTKEIVLTRFSLGPFEEKNFAVNIVSYKKAEANYDGLLGMDFLTKHKYRIDYDKQLLVWE